MVRPAALLLLTFASVAWAEAQWETVVQGPPITVKNRPRENSPVKEVWAEGEIAAPPQDIQAVLMNPDRFKHFMPNLKDCRSIGQPEADGSTFVYTELTLPVVSSRDYVTQVWLDESVKPDGSGTFKNHWKAVPEKIPERKSLVRVKVNDGSWEVRAKGDGSKSHVVYKFAVDPGGWVPAFAANMGNSQAVPQTYQAVEKEAQRLAAIRLAKAKQAPPPAPVAPAADAGALAAPPVVSPK